jgi:hypothetical protein
VLVCSERKVPLAGGWFVLRENYCWLVADKPSEQDVAIEITFFQLSLFTMALGHDPSELAAMQMQVMMKN